jgi:anchored repeat-type ABC transporter ATP-binding subunit
LRLDDITVAYGANIALETASVTCAPGEILGLLGPNGAGKSTLLKAVLGLVPIQQGRVLLDGRPLDRRARAHVSYTPQRGEVDWTFPITVEEVVVMGRQGRWGIFGRPRKDDWRIARDALGRLGVSELRRAQIGELSGGQQQRVFLARALAQEGDALLLDEPLTGVDAQTQAVVLELLTELRDEGRAIMLTTHDLAQAAEMCDRVCLLNRQIVAAGRPADVLTPRVLMETYGGHEVVRLVDGIELLGLPHGAGEETDPENTPGHHGAQHRAS